MTNISFSELGNTPFEQLIGHNAQLLNSWNQLEEAFWAPTILDHNLKEQVRRAMAFENGCEYCMVKAGKPDYTDADIRISIAIGFATLFYQDHYAIGNDHFDMLRGYFTDKEISALCTFISFINAAQKLGKIFNLTAEYQQHAIVKRSEIE